MKLILGNFWPEPSLYPPLGLGYLASYLRKRLQSLSIEIIDTRTDPIEKILASRPGIVGFTSNTFNYKAVSRLAAQVRDRLKVPLFVGGPHITAMPQNLGKVFDFGVIGEGEETVLELIKLFLENKSLSLSILKKIDGLCLHQGEDVILTRPRPFVDILDRIPPPERSLLDMNLYLKFDYGYGRKIKGTSILTSRGCPYRCIYCQAAKLWGKPRLHSARYVAEEIKDLYHKYAITVFSIVDDLFIIDRGRIIELIEYLERFKLLGKVRFWVDGRANLLDVDLMKILKKLNVECVSLGIESGSDRILRYLKKDSVTVEQNREALRLVNRFGMRAFIQLMLGTPTETVEDMALTREFALTALASNGNNTLSLGIITPLPGTELWQYANSKGLVSGDMDWDLLEMKPYVIFSCKPNFVYLNESVDRKTFLKVVRSIQEIIDYQTLKAILKRPDWKYIWIGIKKFGRAKKLFKGFLKTMMKLKR